MPGQTSRRTFLTLAGASVGLLATRQVQASEPGRAPGPAPRAEQAVIVGFSGTELEVRVEASGRRETLEPRDFGDWKHQIGDRVVVFEDPSGRRSVKPFVTTVDAPLPGRPSHVEIGSLVKIGDRTARISSESLRGRFEALRSRSPRAVVHWLLIENVLSGEHRVFGVMERP